MEYGQIVNKKFNKEQDAGITLYVKTPNQRFQATDIMKVEITDFNSLQNKIKNATKQGIKAPVFETEEQDSILNAIRGIHEIEFDMLAKITKVVGTKVNSAMTTQDAQDASAKINGGIRGVFYKTFMRLKDAEVQNPALDANNIAVEQGAGGNFGGLLENGLVAQAAGATVGLAKGFYEGCKGFMGW